MQLLLAFKFLSGKQLKQSETVGPLHVKQEKSQSKNI